MYHQDLILSEVLARVAFRIVERDYRRNPQSYECPTTGIYGLAVQLDTAGFRALATWVSCAGSEITAYGCTLAQWRDEVIRRARLHATYRQQGQPWRCAPNPRVTNRGVRSLPPVVRQPWIAGKARCGDETTS